MRICALACVAFPVGEYVIIYRVEKDDAFILRVLRGSRDIEALLRRVSEPLPDRNFLLCYNPFLASK